jgi:hypothetical protein
MLGDLQFKTQYVKELVLSLKHQARSLKHADVKVTNL